MLGAANVYWLDQRLQQATGLKGKRFGGISVILAGDPGQLPPVGDRSLHLKPEPNGNINTHHGWCCYRDFRFAFVLNRKYRQKAQNVNDSNFGKLLDHVRVGNTTEEDYSILQTQFCDNVADIQGFDNAIRLFYRNEDVQYFNKNRLIELGVPILHLTAINSSEEATKANPEDAWGLECTGISNWCKSNVTQEPLDRSWIGQWDYGYNPFNHFQTRRKPTIWSSPNGSKRPIWRRI